MGRVEKRKLDFTKSPAEFRKEREAESASYAEVKRLLEKLNYYVCEEIEYDEESWGSDLSARDTIRQQISRYPQDLVDRVCKDTGHSFP